MTTLFSEEALLAHPRPKKVVLFPEIGLLKLFLSLTLPHGQMYIRIYIFNFKKQRTNKQTKTIIKKTKKTKKEKRISPENRFKKINLRPLGWRFFMSPTFPETRVFSFFSLAPLQQILFKEREKRMMQMIY